MTALWEIFNDYHMGITAENVAEEYGITREMQDAFAAASQQKCEAAQNASVSLTRKSLPVPVKVKKDIVPFARDEFPRAGVTGRGGLAKLRPAPFKKDGTVTAANASGINDGAAAIVVMSAEKGAGAGRQAHGAHRCHGLRRLRAEGDGHRPLSSPPARRWRRPA